MRLDGPRTPSPSSHELWPDLAESGKAQLGDARPWRADFAATIGLLVAVNLSVALPLSAWLTAFIQLAVGATAAAGALHRGYSLRDLGLAREQARAGSRLGAVVAAGVIAVVTVVAMVPATQRYFEDDRFIELSAGRALGEIVVRIPFVTTLTEEVLFRSVLLAVLLVALSKWQAVAVTSLLFGLWHVLPTIDLQANEGNLDVVEWEAVGTVVVTAVAGTVLAWLRLRSGSTVAPWLVHTTVNASAFTAGTVLAA